MSVSASVIDRSEPCHLLECPKCIEKLQALRSYLAGSMDDGSIDLDAEGCTVVCIICRIENPGSPVRVVHRSFSRVVFEGEEEEEGTMRRTYTHTSPCN